MALVEATSDGRSPKSYHLITVPSGSQPVFTGACLCAREKRCIMATKPKTTALACDGFCSACHKPQVSRDSRS